MRKLFLLLAFVALSASAQDVIVKKDGSTILSKVLEVNPDDVKYKKFSNQDGPTYIIYKSELMSINYENGEKDDFSISVSNPAGNETRQEDSSVHKLIEKTPAENNQTIIEQYRGDIYFSKTASNKDAKYFFPIFNVSDSSLMSTEDLEMSFQPVLVYDKNIKRRHLGYNIVLTNKTNRTIYIDMAGTFKIFMNGQYKSYYDTKQTAYVEGNSSGVGVGVGGIANVLGIGGVLGTLANSITLGSSSQNSVMTTYSKDRIKAIPPHATACLTEYQQVQANKYHYDTISNVEGFAHHLYKKDKLKEGGHIFFNEDNTPCFVKYLITYSTSQDFSTYSTLYAKLFSRCVVSGRYDDNKLNKDIQKYISNYMVGYCMLLGSSCCIFDDNE